MSENTIENFKAAVHLIKPGELKAYGEITGAPRAGGAWRDKYGPPRFAAQFGGKFGATRRRPAPASTYRLYQEAGYEFKMPIHRVMSSKDPYGKNDDTGAGLLTFGAPRNSASARLRFLTLAARRPHRPLARQAPLVQVCDPRDRGRVREGQGAVGQGPPGGHRLRQEEAQGRRGGARGHQGGAGRGAERGRA